MATALITGASGGIGAAFAKIHAARGGDLVLVARTKSKLLDLQSALEHGNHIKVYLIEKDLSKPNAAREVYEELKLKGIQVDYLVNNAGFGDSGLFAETDWMKESEMIQLNIVALTQLTKLFLPDMIQRRCGKILNVASTAAFQPGPTMAVYFATKAYVLSFSEALQDEVRDQGVSVTTLCPGPTKSGFQAAASMDDSKLFNNKNIPSAYDVASYGYDAMMKGKSVVVHGFFNNLLVQSLRVAPRALAVRVTRRILKKANS